MNAQRNPSALLRDVVLLLAGSGLVPAANAAPVTVQFALPNLTVTYNNVPGTQTGPHQFIIVIDNTSPDQDPDINFGAYAVTEARLTAPNLGLDRVLITSPTYFFTNGPQLALRFNTPSTFRGQFSPFNLTPVPISDNNSLATLSVPYSGTGTGGQWRTNVNGGANVTLQNGALINLGQDVPIPSSSVTISAGSGPDNLFANGFE
jgi:hypothetical protein